MMEAEGGQRGSESRPLEHIGRALEGIPPKSSGTPLDDQQGRSSREDTPSHISTVLGQSLESIQLKSSGTPLDDQPDDARVGYDGGG